MLLEGFRRTLVVLARRTALQFQSRMAALSSIDANEKSLPPTERIYLTLEGNFVLQTRAKLLAVCHPDPEVQPDDGEQSQQPIKREVDLIFDKTT